MLLTVKEMEVLCVIYSGTLSATLNLLRAIEAGDDVDSDRKDDIKSLTAKLSTLNAGDIVSLAFEPEVSHG